MAYVLARARVGGCIRTDIIKNAYNDGRDVEW